LDFSIGQNIVHPAHGPGTIVGVEERELVKGFHHFYVIEFVRSRLTVRIPFRRAGQIGIRDVMSEERFQRVLDTLRAIPKQLQDDFKSRRHNVEALLCSGRPTQIAIAVRDLTWRKFDRHLTKSDAEQLSKGRDLLATEVAMANGADVQEAGKIIRAAVAVAIANKQALRQEELDAEMV